MNDLQFVALGPDTLGAFEQFHALPECQGCFCMYWHFEGDNKAWQLQQPDDNRAAKRALVQQQRTHGLMAMHQGEVIASVQFEPRDALVKLTLRMPYRGLEPAPQTWAITCFRVREEHRRKGVARALLQATINHLREVHHATQIEAFPRIGDDLRDDEVWTGPQSLFVSLGFECVRDHMQYPIYRKSLRP